MDCPRSAPFIFIQCGKNIGGVAEPVKLAEDPVGRLSRWDGAGIMRDLIKAPVENTRADQVGMPREDAVHRVIGAADQRAINEEMLAYSCCHHPRKRVRLVQPPGSRRVRAP